MFDAPVDAWYVWMGVGVASVVALGAVLALPAAAAPDATSAADVIDTVASAPPGAVATSDLEAASWRPGPRRIALRSAGGASHATVAYGPVTPATRDRLERVLHGAPAPAVFDSPAAFRRAARRAQDADQDWRPAPAELIARHVRWEGVDVTLVG